MRAVAVNVGANTNEPGFRGPIDSEGRFEFVPIPESEPASDAVPTYADLPVETAIPEGVEDRPVHLDPEFAEYGPGDRYTYGDPHGVKARPLLELSEGDHVLFYATLSHRGDGNPREWIAPDWGAYLIGRFELARDPVPGEVYDELPAREREAFATNAHVRRERFDAAVLLEGSARSRLYERAIPLSAGEGVRPNRLVTELSSDSGRGPWWRRPLRFDAAGASELLALEDAPDRRLAALASGDP